MSALIDAVVAALLSYVFLLLPFAVVVDVAVVRCRANRTQAAGLGRSLLAGLGAGVFLVGFAISFIVVVQMIDFR